MCRAFHSGAAERRPRLSVGMVLSVAFFSSSIPRLRSFRLFRLAIRPRRVFFRLKTMLFYGIMPMVRHLPRLFLRPPNGRQLGRDLRPLRNVLRLRTRLHPTRVNNLPNKRVMPNRVVPRPYHGSLPTTLNKLRGMKCLAILHSLLHRQMGNTSRQLNVISNTIIPNRRKTITTLLLRQNRPRRQRATSPPSTSPTRHPNRNTKQRTRTNHGTPRIGTQRRSVLPPPTTTTTTHTNGQGHLIPNGRKHNTNGVNTTTRVSL